MAIATADGSVRLGGGTTSSSIKATMFTQHNAGSGTGCREWADLGTVLEQAARREARLQASLWACQTAWRNNFLSPSSATPGRWALRRMTHTSGGRSGERERPPKPADAAVGLDSSTPEGATKLAEHTASSCVGVLQLHEGGAAGTPEGGQGSSQHGRDLLVISISVHTGRQRLWPQASEPAGASRLSHASSHTTRLHCQMCVHTRVRVAVVIGPFLPMARSAAFYTWYFKNISL